MDNPRDVKIEDIKPEGKKDGYPTDVPRWFTRLFEIIPGVVTWGFILFPFVAGLLGFPEIVVWMVAFLTVYWTYRGIKFAFGLIIAYRRMLHETSVDWMAKIRDEIGEDQIPKYAFICPIVKEGMEILEPTMEALLNQEIGSERISVIFALEEKFTNISKPNCEKLIEKYGKNFREMIISVHPYGIEGEVVGVKGGNINWASRYFVKLLKERGEELHDYLLITSDSDMRPHEKYLSSITYKYLTQENSDRAFYCTAVHTFKNNIWRVPPIIRVGSNALTLALMHAWVFEKAHRNTFSAYVVNLQTVHEVGYWDPEVGIDDTPFYWNAMLRYNGDFRGEEVYAPTHNDAVENETVLKSLKSLYLQQLRWGWGIIVFPITFAGLYKNKSISFWKKFIIVVQLIDNQIFFLTIVYTITFGIPILLITSPEFQFSSAAYNLSRVLNVVLTALMFLNIPVYIIRRKVTPPPKGWSFWRNALDFVEMALVTVNMLTFGFIPYIQAQTEMMFNKFRSKYYATDKVSMRKV